MRLSGGSRGGARGLPSPSFFLDQTEARGAEKKLFFRPGTLIWECLDLPLRLKKEPDEFSAG